MIEGFPCASKATYFKHCCRSQFYSSSLPLSSSIMAPIHFPFSRILLANLRSNCKRFASSCCATALDMKSNITERRVNVWGMNINVTIAGNGPHTVLCTPGMLGSAETDFRPILERLDPTKFTAISWDPPGYGKSRSPSRCQYLESFDNESWFHLDARVADALMKNLGYEFFSVMGFSGGGLASVVFAAEFPHRVNKLCTWSHMARFSKKLVKCAQNMCEEEMWPEDRWDQMIMMYTQKEMKEMCICMAEHFRQLSQQDFKLDELGKDIKAPMLILYGEQDPLVGEDDAQLYNKAVSNSTVEFWLDAGHDLHLQFPDRFVQRVEEFLLS